MKKLAIAVVAALLLPAVASGQVRVKGYVKKDGTYVAPHYRSSPNSTKFDNYSTKGNVNPYTGKVGTTDAYSSPFNSTYSSPFNSTYGSKKSGTYGSSSESDDSYGYDPE